VRSTSCKSHPVLEEPSHLSAPNRLLKFFFEATIVSRRLSMLSLPYELVQQKLEHSLTITSVY